MEVASCKDVTFVYDPLERPDSFRLLKILVSKDGELSCELIHTSLTDPDLPRYSSLSYVWGNPLMNRPIKCNEKTKFITATLETALKYVARHNPHEYLWADQICINQLESEERAQQVNIMGAIFQVSKFVIAFLGTENENTVTAHGLINRISHIAESLEAAYDANEPSERLTDSREISLAESEELGISFAATEEWEALYDFFDNPWFERIWIVQEMLPCQVLEGYTRIESLAITGSHALWWDDIKYAATWIRYKGNNRPNPVNGTPKVDGLSLTMNMRLGFKSGFSKGYGGWSSRGKVNYRTLDLLETFRDRDATDPRDKVYGLLGLSDLQEIPEDFDYKPKIKVDYTKSVKEVYRDLAMALINDQKSLQVLHSAILNSQEPNWPTWLPDWRIRDISHNPHRLPHGFKADNGFPPRLTESPDPDMLSVEGKIIGSASFVHSEHHCPQVVWHVDARVFRQRIIEIMGETYKPTGQTTGTAFTLTLSAGQVFESVQEAGTSAQEFADMALDFLAALKLPRDTQVQRDYRYSQTGKFKKYGFDGGWIPYYLNCLCERRIFVTDTGYMGLGDQHMVEGDVIAILFGLSVACVLRLVMGRPHGTYEFVGEAYVHGVMDGEIAKALPKDAHSDLVIGDKFLLI